MICALSLLTILFQGCASIPVPEPSDQEMNTEAAKAYNEVKAKSKISTNRTWTEAVNRVASRIAKASGETFQWEWVLIEDPQVNAWCMPGGKIAVYTGIMPVLQNEAALAAVLGHEVAHATKRHGKQRYARAMRENIGEFAVAGAMILGGQFFCKTSSCKLLTALGGATAGFAMAFFDRKFSRGDETEADQVGQQYMAAAGYDPSEAIHLWERMAAANPNAPPEWMSDHPSDENRRQNLSYWLPQAEEIYGTAPQKFGLGAKI